MVLEEIHNICNPWCFLQQPTHPEPGTHASFRTLLAALDQGWQVVGPVQVLPSAHADSWTYFWTLACPAQAQTCVLFVPCVPAVERFIEQNHYQVIEGSYYF